MKNFILTTCLLVTSFSLFAGDCFPLYEKKGEDIRQNKAFSTFINGQLYVDDDKLAYWPGLEVPGHIDNWAEDLIGAIKYGPMLYSMKKEDPRKDWLEAFRKSIKSDCSLPDDKYKTLRSMLSELMEDGSFCPGGEVLNRGFLGGKGKFKDVLKEAIRNGRFAAECQGKAVQDDSYRVPKEYLDGYEGFSKQGSSRQ